VLHGEMPRELEFLEKGLIAQLALDLWRLSLRRRSARALFLVVNDSDVLSEFPHVWKLSVAFLAVDIAILVSYQVAAMVQWIRFI
jgi:hypothetical protein